MFDVPTDDRGVSPVLGTVLLVLLTIVLVGVVGTSVLGSTALSPTVRAPVAMDVTADDGGTITVTHDGGRPIDVEAVSVTITVDGTPLSHQPPVPFFSTSGFEPGPTGPFNSASESRWTVGESASVTVAGTNDPVLEPGSTVVVRVVRGERVIASAETSVERGAGDGDEG